MRHNQFSISSVTHPGVALTCISVLLTFGLVIALPHVSTGYVPVKNTKSLLSAGSALHTGKESGQQRRVAAALCNIRHNVQLLPRAVRRRLTQQQRAVLLLVS